MQGTRARSPAVQAALVVALLPLAASHEHVASYAHMRELEACASRQASAQIDESHFQARMMATTNPLMVHMETVHSTTIMTVLTLMVC